MQKNKPLSDETRPNENIPDETRPDESITDETRSDTVGIQTDELPAVKKLPIRFYQPRQRIFDTVVPLVSISLVCGILMLACQTSVVFLLIVAEAAYLTIEFFLLRRYLFQVPSARRYFCTNVLAFLVLFAVALMTMYGGVYLIGQTYANIAYTLFFMPLKFFSYIEGLSKWLSAAVMCGIYFGMSMLLPIIYVRKK